MSEYAPAATPDSGDWCYSLACCMCPVACEHPSGTFGRVACVLTLKSALSAAERFAPFGGLGTQRGIGRPHFARPHAKPLQTPSSEHMSSDRNTDKSLVTNSVTGEDGEPLSKPLWNGDLTLLSRWLDLLRAQNPQGESHVHHAHQTRVSDKLPSTDRCLVSRTSR